MKYPAYPNYKDSGVEWLGEVPEHWEVKRLKFVFPRLYSGVSVNSENIEADQDSVGVLKTSCVYGNRFNSNENKRVLEDELDRVACPVTADSLIISRMNTPELVGSCGYVEKDCPNIYLPDRLWIARFSGHKTMLGKFAWYFSVSDAIVKLTGALATGTSGSMKNLSQEAFLNIPALLPTLPEQAAIADFLDRETGRIDTLVAKKRRLIALLKEKRTALISRTVTRGLPADAAQEFGLTPHTRFKDSGIEWLGEVPEGWETPPLYARYTVELGKMLNESRITGNHLVPYLRNVDVQWDGINLDDLPEMDIPQSEYQRYTVQPGDLLVCEGGEVGRAAIVGGLSSLIGYQKALHRLRASRSGEVVRFMYYTLYWAAKSGVFNAGGVSTIAHLTGEQLRKYRFPAPSHAEQTAIATYLDRETAKLDRLVEKIEAAIARLQEYRTALITAAVTGKIDVRQAAGELAA